MRPASRRCSSVGHFPNVLPSPPCVEASSRRAHPSRLGTQDGCMCGLGGRKYTQPVARSHQFRAGARFAATLVGALLLTLPSLARAHEIPNEVSVGGFRVQEGPVRHFVGDLVGAGAGRARQETVGGQEGEPHARDLERVRPHLERMLTSCANCGSRASWPWRLPWCLGCCRTTPPTASGWPPTRRRSASPCTS